MQDTVIKVENLSKKYIIGHQGKRTYKTFREQMFEEVGNIFSKTKRLFSGQQVLSENELEEFWALKDVNFEIKQGDRVGIIGKNGAGKSTLLKILSRITEPTTGKVSIKGRVASLLEVGTGFHQELSGRENIYLNGAILGMSRIEIKKKFDEIVEFSGVEKFLDTPVKRYSSGMYVRLAFSVAAHLEPEILIVDEVLAVGDAEFQKKCLGRMRDVSKNEGKTVLFVSHNLQAIRALCQKGILLSKGIVLANGTIESVLEKYQMGSIIDKNGGRDYLPVEKLIYFKSWFINQKTNQTFSCLSRDKIKIGLEYVVNNDVQMIEFGLILRDLNGEIIVGANSRDNDQHFINLKKGSYELFFEMELPLKPSVYELDFAVAQNGELIDQWVSNTKLQILNQYNTVLDEKWTGLLNIETSFATKQLDV